MNGEIGLDPALNDILPVHIHICLMTIGVLYRKNRLIICAIVVAFLAGTIYLAWLTQWKSPDLKNTNGGEIPGDPRPEPIGKTTNNRGILVDLCNNDKENEIPDSQHMNSTGYHVPDSPVVEDKFTLVMLTHDRDEILRNVLRWYGNMTKIDSIILYWNNPGKAAPNFYQELNLSIPIITEEVNITNLGDRFQPNSNIRTDGRLIFQSNSNAQTEKD